jgi:tellurite resistance protein
MDFFHEVELDGKTAEAIARGLFAVAKVDGIHEREAGLIAAFWMDAGAGHGLLSDLEREETPITGSELAAALRTTQERLLFMKTALLLTYADGKVTPEERQIISEFGTALGIDAQTIDALETAVKEYLLRHLAHLHNAEAVADVAKKLEV